MRTMNRITLRATVCAVYAVCAVLWAPAVRAHDDLERQWAPTAADAQAAQAALPAPQVLPGAKPTVSTTSVSPSQRPIE